MTVLAFFLSPLGRYIGIGLIVAAAFGGTWLHGDSNGADRIQTKWNASREAARVEKARLDSVAADNAASQDAADATAEASTDQSNLEARDAYVKKLEASVCVLDDDARSRLSNIK
jgi:hypothetical protein